MSDRCEAIVARTYRRCSRAWAGVRAGKLGHYHVCEQHARAKHVAVGKRIARADCRYCQDAGQ